ncbi:SDR family oxidoreductase [Rhodococcus koreensis]
MAREWGAWNIRANALTPGLIVDENNLTGDAVAKDPALQGLLQRTSLGRAGGADELAAVVVFLTSDAASFLSGTVIPVDGGRF